MHGRCNLCSEELELDKRTTVTTVEKDTSLLQIPVYTIYRKNGEVGKTPPAYKWDVGSS